MNEGTTVRHALGSLLADPNPIAVRELRSAMRTPAFVAASSVGILIVGFLLIAVATSLSFDGGTMASTGDVVFQLFLSAALFLSVLLAPTLGASAFSGEREGHTLEALLLTGVAPRRLVFGKFAGAFLGCAHGVVASLPLVGIAFFYGGMSPLEVVLGVSFILLLIAPLAALGIAISSFVPSTRLAIGLAMAVVIPLFFVAIGGMTAVSAELSGAVDGGRDGPFGWLGALAAHPTDPSIVGGLLVAPVLVVAICTWFFLSVAEWLTAPVGIVRIRPLQLFHVVASLLVFALQAILLVVVDADDRQSVDVAFAVVLGPSALLAMLFFGAESPLVPTSFVPSSRPLRGAFDRVFPPDALGTTRFALLSTAFGLTICSTISRIAAELEPAARIDEHRAVWFASVVGLSGSFVLGAVLLHVIAHIGRLRRRASGPGFGAAVLLTLVGLFVFVIVTLTISIPFFARDEQDEFSRFVLGLMPFAPAYAASWVIDHPHRTPTFFFGFLGLYGGAAVALRLMLVRAIRRMGADRAAGRAALEARIRAREEADGGVA